MQKTLIIFYRFLTLTEMFMKIAPFPHFPAFVHRDPAVDQNKQRRKDAEKVVPLEKDPYDLALDVQQKSASAIQQTRDTDTCRCTCAICSGYPDCH